MKLSTLSAAVAVVASSLVAASPTYAKDHELDKRQLPISAYRYCSGSTGMCYNSYETAGKSTYRFAIPTGASGADYDIAFQLVAPRQTGWIGIGWGGGMLDCPLTVAWQNGGTVMVSSRYATQHIMPATYSGPTYKILADTNVNATHWTLSGICTGCSRWTTSSGTQKWLDPTSGGLTVAWAQNPYANTVSQPSNPNSNFEYHDYLGSFKVDFRGSSVDTATFSAAAAKLVAANAASQQVPPAASAPLKPAQPAQPAQPANPWGCWFGC